MSRAAQLARLAAAAARRVEMLEAAVAAAVAAADVAADVAAARARGGASTRWRPRDTRRDDAARARAVALAGLECARLVEAAALLAVEAEAAKR